MTLALIATATLAISTVIAATVVTIGIARADVTGTSQGGDALTAATVFYNTGRPNQG